MICGIGRCLPPRVLTNEQVIARGRLDTTDEWITTRTGIERRRYAAADVSTGDLATAAAHAALRSASGSASDTCVPESAESGFAESESADVLLLAARPLMVAAEKYSAIIDPCDRGTAPIFGDGAAAVLLRAGRAAEPGAVLAVDWGSDGGGSDLVAITAGGSRRPASERPAPEEYYFRMRGGQVYAHAVRRMTQSAQAVLASTGWKPQDVEAFIGHQANQRILDSVADRLGIEPRHNLGNIRELGNTAAASVPLALADAASRGTRRPGAPTLLTAFGGGLTWGSATLHWPDAAVFEADVIGRTAMTKA